MLTIVNKVKEIVKKSYISILFIIFPFINALFYVMFLKVDFFKIHPTYVQNDAFFYYLPARSIAFAFEKINIIGYFGLNEGIAKYMFFDAHGAFPASIYGIFMSIIHIDKPWVYIAINLVLLSIVFSLIEKIIKPDIKQRAFIVVFFATFYYVQLFLLSFMSEMYNLIFMSAFIVVFYALLKNNEKRMHNIYMIVFIGIYFILLLTRISYVCLIFIVCYAITKKFSKKYILNLFFFLFLSFLTFLFANTMQSYFPNSLTLMMEQLKQKNFDSAANLFVEHFIFNCQVFLHEAGSLILVNKLFALFLTLVLLCFGIYTRVVNKQSEKDNRSSDIYMIFFLTLASIWAILWLFYDPFEYRALRVLAPLIFAFFIYLIANKRYIIPVIIISVSLVTYPYVLGNSFSICSSHFVEIRTQQAQELFSHLELEDSDSRFNNTIASDSIIDEFIELPPGFGVTFIINGFQNSSNLKSKYFFTSNITVENIDGYTLIARNEIGSLFCKK